MNFNASMCGIYLLKSFNVAFYFNLSFFPIKLFEINLLLFLSFYKRII